MSAAGHAVVNCPPLQVRSGTYDVQTGMLNRAGPPARPRGRVAPSRRGERPGATLGIQIRLARERDHAQIVMTWATIHHERHHGRSRPPLWAMRLLMCAVIGGSVVATALGRG